MGEYYDNLKDSLNEALRHSKGEEVEGLVVRKREVPISIELRKELNLTQKALAQILGVSKRTVEAWEINKSHPTVTALKLMNLIKQDKSIISRLV